MTKTFAHAVGQTWREGCKLTLHLHNTIETVSSIAARNYPLGSDDPHLFDSHLRELYAFIAQLRDRVQSLELQVELLRETGKL